jgi:hypothetical protein
MQLKQRKIYVVEFVVTLSAPMVLSLSDLSISETRRKSIFKPINIISSFDKCNSVVSRIL